MFCKLEIISEEIIKYLEKKVNKITNYTNYLKKIQKIRKNTEQYSLNLIQLVCPLIKGFCFIEGIFRAG